MGRLVFAALSIRYKVIVEGFYTDPYKNGETSQSLDITTYRLLAMIYSKASYTATVPALRTRKTEREL